MMLVYTVQDINAYNDALKTGILRANMNHIDSYWSERYDYMVKQMQLRIGYASNDYPIWVMDTSDNYEYHITPSKKSVLLSVEVDESLILWSSYDAWHCVLNGSYCSLSEEDDDWFENTIHDNRRLLIEKSWERIFDNSLIDKECKWYGDTLQGCVGYINMADVKSVTHFVGKSTW